MTEPLKIDKEFMKPTTNSIRRIATGEEIDLITEAKHRSRNCAVLRSVLVAELLDRLEKAGTEPLFDTHAEEVVAGAGLWRASCPISSDHPAFLVATVSDANADYESIDLFCAEHTTAELCRALGYRVAGDHPTVGRVGNVDLLPDEDPS